MIYRLAHGARSDLKKHLASGSLVLLLTAGFPVLAAWANQEQPNPSNPPFVTGVESGAVLGEQTENTPTQDTGDQPMPVSHAASPTPSKPLRATNKPAEPSPAASSASTPEDSSPTAPATPLSEPTDPAPELSVEPVKPAADEPLINVELLDRVELDVNP